MRSRRRDSVHRCAAVPPRLRSGLHSSAAAAKAKYEGQVLRKCNWPRGGTPGPIAISTREGIGDSGKRVLIVHNIDSGLRTVGLDSDPFAVNPKDNGQDDSGKGLASLRVMATPLPSSQRELCRYDRVTEVCRSRAITNYASTPLPGPAIGEATSGAR